MSRLGLLEGNGLRFKFGAALVNPADYNGSANARDFYTTDWMDPAQTDSAYSQANAKTLDPEAWPTLALFRQAHGGAPAFQDPGPSIQVSTPMPGVLANPPAYSDAEYRAQAIANEAEAARIAALPRDTVTGPTFIPDTQNAASAPSNVSSTLPVTAASPSSIALPLLAAVAAYFALKGH